jgi:uncharacterized protein GlcG (DUF336 family)
MLTRARTQALTLEGAKAMAAGQFAADRGWTVAVAVVDPAGASSCLLPRRGPPG